MLISHRKKFIFTKTVKTAGTSVESFFERYCVPEGEWQETHLRGEYVSDTGIIGSRGPTKANPTWREHMPASKIYDLIGSDIWTEYFKFTVIRNPFDKLVSAFYFFSSGSKGNYTFARQCKIYAKRLFKIGPPEHRVLGKTHIERFRDWVKISVASGDFEGASSQLADRDKYFIGGKVCVDYFIQFEDLLGGLTDVCDRLSIPESEIVLPTFKKGFRSGRIPVRDYYDDATEAIVRKLYDWEIEQFDYKIPD